MKESEMDWAPYYQGYGEPRVVKLPPAPELRAFATDTQPKKSTFQPPPGLVEAVNAALCLRRPLLITGAPGSGKSSVADSIATELTLGSALRWHITSRSSLTDALYRYDALGRLDAYNRKEDSAIGNFIELGPLGTALLPQDDTNKLERPRVLLIDEIDKSDIDLPSDLLNVLERGEFNIPELTRHNVSDVHVRRWKEDDTAKVHKGQIQCTTFPVIVMTSNGERDFPAPFLRRCIRFTMPNPDAEQLAKIVRAHLGEEVAQQADVMLRQFADDLSNDKRLATDQLLNAIFLVNNAVSPVGPHREKLVELLLKTLA